MSDIEHYTYRVTWSADDGEYVGTVAEFPSLSWLDREQVPALVGIRDLVREVVTDMENSGESVPVPLADRQYSGVFKLRIPPELHRALALQAAEERVSLNRLVNSKLVFAASSPMPVLGWIPAGAGTNPRPNRSDFEWSEASGK